MGRTKLDKDFDSLQDLKQLQREMFKTLDEACEKHGENLVQFGDKKPFCSTCADITAKHHEALLMNKGTNKAYDHKKRWLKERSIAVDRGILNLSFDMFETMDDETTRNKELALQHARTLYKGSTDNVLLAGKFGTGKTHLAIAMINQLNEHLDKRCLFVETNALMRAIQSSFGEGPGHPMTTERAISLLVRADFLVLDDLGSEVGSVEKGSTASDWTTKVINDVLHGRQAKPTIITSNLSVPQIEETYGGRVKSRVMRGIEKDDIVQFKRTTDKRSRL